MVAQRPCSCCFLLARGRIDRLSDWWTDWLIGCLSVVTRACCSVNWACGKQRSSEEFDLVGKSTGPFVCFQRFYFVLVVVVISFSYWLRLRVCCSLVGARNFFLFFCCCCFLHFSLLTSLSLFCLFSLGRFLFFISLGAAVAVYFRFDYIFLRNCAFTARRNLNLVNVSFVCGFLYFWFFFLIFTIICCGACHLLMDLSLGKDKHIFLNLTSIDLLSLFQNIFWYFFCCCLLKRVWLVYALKYVSKILLHLYRILIILILLIFLIFILIIHMV